MVLRDITLDLDRGVGACLVGANGTGKSTLLRAVAGLLPAESGSVTVTLPLRYLDAHPLPSLRTSVADWLKERALLSGVPYDTEPYAVTPRLYQPLQTLSSGWRQRVKLSQLVADGQSLWLLDEAEESLDTDGVAMLQQVVRRHLSLGGVVMTACHQPALWPDFRMVAL